VGLLSALFYALAVLPIQLSHFMTVDTITNTFAFLAVYAAVWAFRRQPAHGEEELILSERCEEKNTADNTQADETPGFDFSEARRVIKDLAPYILFGIALGAATASKINAVVIAMILPLVEGMRYFGMDADEKNEARSSATWLWPGFSAFWYFASDNLMLLMDQGFSILVLMKTGGRAYRICVPRLLVMWISHLPCSGRGAQSLFRGQT